ncbi:MAG TPA: TonB-dependent receptor plug domain-containing protein, partial [Amphiplicatus sp.]|nr:TonB-dependent receptor plug domain-containing protein [Amphiplicatus sp.]
MAAELVAVDEMVVTATKMGETNLQETPIAITAFSGEQVDRTGIKDVRDLMAMTPNLNVAQNAAFAQIYIRGIGSNNVFSGADPSSTIHIDGVYIARPASYFTSFLDVERIEVLRGPQGTLYGRNSVGGTINVITRRPDNEFQAKLQGTVGNYDLYRVEGYVSGPIIEDKLAASVSMMRSKRDGYLKNVAPGAADLDSEDLWSGRVQLRATPTDRLEILVRGDYSDDDGQAAGNVKLLLPYAPL